MAFRLRSSFSGFTGGKIRAHTHRPAQFVGPGERFSHTSIATTEAMIPDKKVHRWDWPDYEPFSPKNRSSQAKASSCIAALNSCGTSHNFITSRSPACCDSQTRRIFA